MRPIHSSVLPGVLLSPRAAHIPAELCDSAGGKLSAGMERQQLFALSPHGAQIYDGGSSKRAAG